MPPTKTSPDFVDAFDGKFVEVELASDLKSESGILEAHGDHHVTFKGRATAIAKEHIARIVPKPEQYARQILDDARHGILKNSALARTRALEELRDEVLDAARGAGWSVEGETKRERKIKQATDDLPTVSLSVNDTGDSLTIATRWRVELAQKDQQTTVTGIRFDDDAGGYVCDDGEPAMLLVARIVADALAGRPLPPPT